MPVTACSYLTLGHFWPNIHHQKIAYLLQKIIVLNSKNSWQFLARLCLHSPRDYSIAMTRADTRWTNLAQFLTPGIMGNQLKEITEIRENEENRRKVD